MSISILSRDERETLNLGRRMGLLLKRGDVVCIHGELGAGKTVLIKGILSQFGIDERDVGSASFIIAQEYPLNKRRHDIDRIYHIDLYRLETVEDDEWIWEYMDGENLCVIEWAERLRRLPEGAINVYINIKSENEREIRIEGINKENWNNLEAR